MLPLIGMPPCRGRGLIQPPFIYHGRAADEGRGAARHPSPPVKQHVMPRYQLPDTARGGQSPLSARNGLIIIGAPPDTPCAGLA